MKKGMSLLRKLQYEELSKIKIDGKVLDLGGDRRSGYHELIAGDHQISVVNINKECEVDLNFNIEQAFPIGDETYDAILCLNVLEHIFNYQNVLNEGFRVLKHGGKFIGATPFLFNVHGSPDDYFRYTKSALEKMFKQAGFKDIIIRELGSGVFSVLFQLKYGFYRINFIRNLAMRFHVMLDQILINKILKSIRPSHHLSVKKLPLGYFFIASKE